ncbi:MAG: radical SAM family heme chaperone HemW [Candidatus Omnitrophica bacterium]|nr:radical SAM family heme chaperone HemW [Candidatus Omnitrophota bacterium]
MSSLYIHIPFCHRKCFYCSFVVSIGQEKKQNEYVKCLEKESRSFDGMSLDTVYFGGGTPTLLDTETLKELFGLLRQRFLIKAEAEVTIEANPEGLSPDKLSLLLDCGINRISLGVQSLNDRYLKYLGRNHDRGLALKTYRDIGRAGFKNVNCDFMYAFPGQTMAELEEDIRAILELRSQHLSLYTLTIEERSRFFTKGVSLENQDYQAMQFAFITRLLEEYDFQQYEVSNFAREGFESRHNINYWTGGDYIGLGVGAHSHIKGRRSWNGSSLSSYLAAFQNDQSPQEGEEILTQEKQYIERILFGLRMKEGINLETVSKQYNCMLDDQRKEMIELFVNKGLLIYNNHNLTATPEGVLVLDEICSKLI